MLTPSHMVLAGTELFNARQKQASVCIRKGGKRVEVLGMVCCFERDMESNWEIGEYMGANETFNTTSTPGTKTQVVYDRRQEITC